LNAENVISRDRVDELLREVFREIQAMGGKARPKELLGRLTLRLHLTPYERESTASGRVRWETIIRWYTVDCSKVGYLEKSGGYWILTALGEQALKLPPGELVRTAQLAYRAWRSQQQAAEPELVELPTDQEKVARQEVYEEAIESARTGIEEHLGGLGPYEFQNLVAELLRGMGYHVPYVASPGPDGGIDLVAYRDPLGTSAPRIKVQVKHRQSKVGAKDVRELEGLLRREGDIGLLVSSGGFSSDAEREARASHKHIELMDLDRLISLWEEHYASLREAGRTMLRLVTVNFLAPEEE
jgi:restriction system protein